VSRRQSLAVAVLAAAILLVPGASAPGAAPSEGALAHVAGEVLSWNSGEAVPGATIRLPDFGVSATSGPNGRFEFPEALQTNGPYRRIRAVVTARGFGSWTVSGLPLVAGETLRLHAEMRTVDWSHRVPEPGAEPEAERRAPSTGARGANTCTGWDVTLLPPPTIRVFLHEEGVSREYDFYFYAAHVLPREWIPSWDADALAAGNIAVKTYAAFRAKSGNAYSGGPGCADVIDTTADQVFDPTYSTSATDQAVYASMASILRRGKDIFLAQYWSGDPENSSQGWKKCRYVDTGPFEGRMSQWGTQVCAENGKLWPEITQVFYPDTNWRYLGNLLLNPSFEAAVGTQPWVPGDTTTLTRVSGSAYNGKWYASATPGSPGTFAHLHETLPIVGKAQSTYRSQAGVRCPSSNATDCTVFIKINYITTGGSRVQRKVTLTVSRDSAWHLLVFDPATAGISHAHIEMVLSSKQTIWVDGLSLTTPYGGP
jgi:hypothetical protein